jgi:hypothetical protein
LSSVQRRSRRQEQKVADRLGGQRTPGSGSGWSTKNDVKTNDTSVEVKYTDKKSYSLKLADLLRAEKQALQDSGRGFAFLVGFGTLYGSNMRIDHEYVVIPRADWEALRHGHSE